MEIGSVTTLRGFSATPTGARQEESASEPAPAAKSPDAPISNPAFRYDITARVAILTYYDESGEVESQIPAEQVVELYRQNGLRQAAGVENSLLTPFEAIRLGIPPGQSGEETTPEPAANSPTSNNNASASIQANGSTPSTPSSTPGTPPSIVANTPGLGAAGAAPSAATASSGARVSISV